MKQDIKPPLSKKVLRQLEILSHYYKIDMENRVIDLVIHTEKTSDFIETQIESINYPKFKTDTLAQVSNTIDSFPAGFKINLILKIDDYEGYDPDVLLKSLKDGLEMFHYSVINEKNKNWILSALLITISAIILTLRVYLVKDNLLEDGGVINEMIDITAWAFLWEAVTILFLSSSEVKEISLKIGLRLLSIKLRDKNDVDIREITRADYVNEWIDDSRKDKIGKALMVIAGTACIITGIMDIVSTSSSIYLALSSNSEPTYSYSFIIASYVVSVLYIIGGIGLISMYKEKGKMQKVVPFFAYAYLVLEVLIFSLLIYYFISINSFDVVIFVEMVKAFLVTTLYFVSYLITRNFRKHKNFE